MGANRTGTKPATCACTPRAAGRGPRWATTSTARLRATTPGLEHVLDGTRVASAPMNRQQLFAGHVAYRRAAGCGPRWAMLDETVGDLSGSSVSMSSDGTRGDRRSRMTALA